MRGTDPNLDVEGPPLDGNLQETAQRVMHSLFPLWEQHREYVDYWEVINEQDPPGVEGQLRLAELMQFCMEIAEAEGYKLALLSYSRGVPEWEEWEAIVNAGLFSQARAGGHVLSLHEYGYPMNQWVGDPLPGRPAYPDRGPLALRYRWLYEDFLIPRGEVIPLYITEANLHGRDIRTMTAEEWLAEMAWYDSELRKDYYVIGAHLFTLGADWWPHYNFEHLVPELTTYLVNKISEINEPWPAAPSLPGYDRTVLVADNNFLSEAQRMELYAEAFERSITITPSWQDARYSPPDARTNTLEAPGVPEEQRQAHEDYVREIDPDAIIIFRDAPGDVPLVPAPELVVTPYSQRDSRWSSIRLGASAYTMGGSGCAVAAATSLASQVSDWTPGDMVRWLNAHGGFTSGGLLYWAKIAEAIEGLSFVRYTTWRDPGQKADLDEVRAVLAREPAILQVDYNPRDSDLDSHFVLGLEWDEARGDVWIVDPIDGQLKWLRDTYGEGRTLARAIFALTEYRVTDSEPPPPPPLPNPVETLLGFNDHPGASTAAQWMQAENLTGLIVRPIFLTGDGARLDFSEAAAAGLRVIVNLRYSWSADLGGGGTMPPLNSPAWVRFVRAAGETIQQSVGVWGWEILNEVNNPREWPGDTTLAPEQIAYTYNEIRRRAGGNFRLAPGALDPFNAEAGDPRNWLRIIYEQIEGAEFVTAHGYIRGPNSDLVGSGAKFADAPLQWQYLNYPGCITALLEALPSRYRGLPLYITEFNHLWRYGGEGDWGWVRDERAGEVVDAAYDAARLHGYAGLALYRWSGDEWRLETNGYVLETVKQLIS